MRFAALIKSSFAGALPTGPGDFRADLIAGISVAMILVPQAMAYAQLAGLPPVYGLYAACVPLLVTALTGSCPQLSTGPVAMTSLLVFSVLAAATGNGMGGLAYEEKALLLAFLAGGILILLAAFKLNAIVNFVSHPVMTGFTHAGALIIIMTQLPSALGLPSSRGSILAGTLRLAERWRDLHLPSLAFALLAILIILLARRINPRIPGVLLAVVLTGLLSAWTRFAESAGGSVVGFVPDGLPPLTWPLAHWRQIPSLLPGAAAVAIIGFMEVMAITRVVGIKTRCRYNLRRELLSQGLARVAGSFTGAFPVSGSLSRTALNLYTGARTRFSSLVTAGFVLLTLLVLTPLLRPLPQPVLAAIIITAILPLFHFSVMKRIWAASWQDGLAAWVTFAATLLMAPHIINGIAIGAALSVGLFLYRTMRPHVALLAPHADGTYRDATRHGLEQNGEVLLLRFEGRLFFANVESFEQAVTGALADHPKAKSLLIVGDGINEIDASGEEMLRQLVRDLRENGVTVGFTGLKWKVMDVLNRTGLSDLVGPEFFFRTTHAGYRAMKKESEALDQGLGI
jgi:SulP family sulfate permease